MDLYGTLSYIQQFRNFDYPKRMIWKSLLQIYYQEQLLSYFTHNIKWLD